MCKKLLLLFAFVILARQQTVCSDVSSIVDCVIVSTSPELTLIFTKGLINSSSILGSLIVNENPREKITLDFEKFVYQSYNAKEFELLTDGIFDHNNQIKELIIIFRDSDALHFDVNDVNALTKIPSDMKMTVIFDFPLQNAIEPSKFCFISNKCIYEIKQTPNPQVDCLTNVLSQQGDVYLALLNTSDELIDSVKNNISTNSNPNTKLHLEIQNGSSDNFTHYSGLFDHLKWQLLDIKFTKTSAFISSEGIEEVINTANAENLILTFEDINIDILELANISRTENTEINFKSVSINVGVFSKFLTVAGNKLFKFQIIDSYFGRITFSALNNVNIDVEDFIIEIKNSKVATIEFQESFPFLQADKFRLSLLDFETTALNIGRLFKQHHLSKFNTFQLDIFPKQLMFLETHEDYRGEYQFELLSSGIKKLELNFPELRDQFFINYTERVFNHYIDTFIKRLQNGATQNCDNYQDPDENSIIASLKVNDEVINYGGLDKICKVIKIKQNNELLNVTCDSITKTDDCLTDCNTDCTMCTDDQEKCDLCQVGIFRGTNGICYDYDFQTCQASRLDIQDTFDLHVGFSFHESNKSYQLHLIAQHKLKLADCMKVYLLKKEGAERIDITQYEDHQAVIIGTNNQEDYDCTSEEINAGSQLKIVCQIRFQYDLEGETIHQELIKYGYVYDTLLDVRFKDLQVYNTDIKTLVEDCCQHTFSNGIVACILDDNQDCDDNPTVQANEMFALRAYHPINYENLELQIEAIYDEDGIKWIPIENSQDPSKPHQVNLRIPDVGQKTFNIIIKVQEPASRRYLQNTDQSDQKALLVTTVNVISTNSSKEPQEPTNQQQVNKDDKKSQSDDDDDQVTLKIAIGVGCGVFGILLIVGIFFFIKTKQLKKQQYQETLQTDRKQIEV